MAAYASDCALSGVATDTILIEVDRGVEKQERKSNGEGGRTSCFLDQFTVIECLLEKAASETTLYIIFTPESLRREE